MQGDRDHAHTPSRRMVVRSGQLSRRWHACASPWRAEAASDAAFQLLLGQQVCHTVNHATGVQASKSLQPMLATLTDAPFDDPGWVFENKWDGFRMVASIERGKVTLYSRNGKIISDSYLPVARALEKIKRDVVIDGELVARDAHGISRFQLLQNALRAEAKLLYCHLRHNVLRRQGPTRPWFARAQGPLFQQAPP
jgi:ATP-dependent DNA ligase